MREKWLGSNRYYFLGLILILFLPSVSMAQVERGMIQSYLLQQAPSLGLTETDLQNYEVTNEVPTKHNGVTHVYIRQTHQGIPVFQAMANLAIKEGQVVYMSERLEANLAQRAVTTQPTLSAAQAIEAAAQQLTLGTVQAGQLLENKNDQQYRFAKGAFSQKEIPVRLMYQPGPEGELFLVWDLSIYPIDGNHWWSVRIDALTGEMRSRIDWVDHCDLPSHPGVPHVHNHAHHAAHTATQVTSSPGTYRVFPYYTESPNHGPRTLEVEPADSIASPFGWHDTDGIAGAEFTITRGNNVLASEDRNADNVPGYSPDGGASLNFDFPLDFNQQPIGYEDAAITNLFYFNNMMHDIWYHYGFDEASGNFQANNYGNGGLGGDEVDAQAQDGGGTNNANFGTPPDGDNPRMQMFLWTSGGGGSVATVLVNSPGTIAGTYNAEEAGFGPGLTAPITGDFVVVDDNTNPDPNDGCEALINGAALNGKIAVVYRGNCTFVTKVLAAQNAGALAVIVINNVPGGTIAMGGNGAGITIPSVMVSQGDGATIVNEINAGSTVNGTLSATFTGNFDRDGDFDNGIIAHEYTHGISNRLTGGPSQSGCLFGDEQMGEGWSDYYALMMVIDTAMVDRGIGTFAIGQSTTGVGIRPARYSPDFSINPFTYGDVANPSVSQPHGIGFVWCTMLWDLTLDFIDVYGFDSDLHYGTGGNNMMMQLVTDGLKLQPCNPGFVDGRDAIIAADDLAFGGANKCMIWEAFAARGLGASASQGSALSRTDQVEAFDIPLFCQIPVLPPVAAFAFEAGGGCGDRVSFTDESTSIPQGWDWDFGDGATDTIQNPTHTYLASGTYTVTLIVDNTLGNDTVIQTVTVALPAGPLVANAGICADDSAQLVATGTGIHTWYDANGDSVGSGATFQTPPLNVNTTYFVDQIIPATVQNGGPVDNTFGPGGYHNTGFTGTVNFTAFEELTIVSVWIDAGSPGPRTIFLWEGADASGPIVDQVTINVPAGPQRVNLGLSVPNAGDYSVGGASIDLYRNSANANYPYVVAGLLEMTSSSATTGAQDFYYYLYDWEVRGAECLSDRVPVEVNISSAEFAYQQNSGTLEVVFSDSSQNGFTWEWTFGDGVTSNMQNPTHTYTAPGTYEVTLTVNGACKFTDSVIVESTTGLQEVFPGVSLSLTPNPAQTQVRLELSQPITAAIDLRILTLEGKEVAADRVQAGASYLDLNLKGLSPAVYMLEARTEVGNATLRLVVTP